MVLEDRVRVFWGLLGGYWEAMWLLEKVTGSHVGPHACEGEPMCSPRGVQEPDRRAQESACARFGLGFAPLDGLSGSALLP